MCVPDWTVPLCELPHWNAVVHVKFSSKTGFVFVVADATFHTFVPVPFECLPSLFVPDTAVEITLYSDIFPPTTHRTVLGLQ